MTSPIDLLMRDKPSKKWSIVFLGCQTIGFLLTSYADNVANKLAPAKAPQTLEGSMTVPDEDGDARVDHDDAGATVSTFPIRFADDLDSLDIETVAEPPFDPRD